MEVLVLISTLGLTRSRSRLALVGISVILAATACSSVAVEPPPTPPQSPPSSNATAPQSPPSSNAVQQLAGQVSDARAVKHLQALQKIADEHGGNRAAGTPGYAASVEYVAGVLRGAGFEVGTPTLSLIHI